ncbi:hypothetical protein DFH06DRAFT_1337522, partial [Mycena polygramma]
AETEKRKKKPKVNLKAPEPPAKPKSLSRLPPIVLNPCRVHLPGEFGWADIRFPISYDESTVLPRFAYIREYRLSRPASTCASIGATIQTFFAARGVLTLISRTRACYTLAERSAKKAEWRNLVTAHNASEAERVRLAVDVYNTKHAEWASRASVRIEKARARDQYEIEAISTYNRKRQETFDEFSSRAAYCRRDTSTTAESGPSWRPKRGRAPLELHPAIESLSETDLPKSVLDEVLGPNGFKEDLSKYDLQTLVTILRVMKIQGVMIGEARSQTYISMYMGSENEYDPDAWHKDNSPFDPNAGTGHRVRGWSVDAESSGYIEGFVQDELIPAVIARRMCFYPRDGLYRMPLWDDSVHSRNARRFTRRRFLHPLPRKEE